MNALKFKTPAECERDLDSELAKTRYQEGRRMKERQVLCDTCRRWKFSNQRCNLFVAVPPRRKQKVTGHDA